MCLFAGGINFNHMPELNWTLGYPMAVPTIRHYLIVSPAKKVVIHHARNAAGDISTRISSSGEVNLTPPRMTVAIAELLPEIG